VSPHRVGGGRCAPWHALHEAVAVSTVRARISGLQCWHPAASAFQSTDAPPGSRAGPAEGAQRAGDPGRDVAHDVHRHVEGACAAPGGVALRAHMPPRFNTCINTPAADLRAVPGHCAGCTRRRAMLETDTCLMGKSSGIVQFRHVQSGMQSGARVVLNSMTRRARAVVLLLPRGGRGPVQHQLPAFRRPQGARPRRSGPRARGPCRVARRPVKATSAQSAMSGLPVTFD